MGAEVRGDVHGVPAAAPGAIPAELLTAFRAGGEMGRRMLTHDWAASALGAPAEWPPELRGVVKTMLASRAQIVIFWGPRYIALYNDAYVPTMGVKHPDFLGCPGRDMWTEAWDVIEPLFAGVVASGAAFWSTDHQFMLERHGFLEETYFDVSYDPVRLADGTVGGIFCIVSDTTTRVLGGRRVSALSALGSRLADPDTEQELGRQVAAVLGECTADVPVAALYLRDAESGDLQLAGVSGVEASACRPPSGPPGRALQEVLDSGEPARIPMSRLFDPPPDAAAEQAVVLPVTAGTETVGALAYGPSRYLALDEQYRHFFDLAAAQVSRAVGNLRAYEQERRRAAELAALDQAKTNFFSNVSHEFRTPLTLILGPLEDVLAAPDLLDVYRERLITMQRNGLRLLKLVNTVLDFSRLESGRLQAAYRPTDLADYTARLTSTFRSAVDRAGLRLVVDTPPLAEPIYVDREMWEKIVLNLLSNAVKFTFDGQIAVRVRAGRDGAVMEVADTGAGIPAAELPLLFERFHRVIGARSRSHEGTGIGLALVRELAELHGGSVSVTSEPGVGSTFTVTVPFGRGHLPADRVVEQGSPVVEAIDTRLYVEEARWWVDESVAAAAIEPTPASTPVPAGMALLDRRRRGRILLADDNADLRDHVAGLLRPHWDVTAVVDGQAAVEAATSDRYDLVLTDVMMPRLDGFGVVKALRSNPDTRDLPIVILSARAGEEASVEGLAAGADDYLVKPFSARDLLARVRANLELGQLRGHIIRQLRGLVDAAADIGRVRTTAEVLRVAAGHVRRMTDA
ncbi:MAG TPA: ATP-binding protein, partial [Catenuloplanes sp.]